MGKLTKHFGIGNSGHNSISPSAEFRHFGSFRSEKIPDDSEIIKDGPVHFKVRVRAGENKKVGYYRSWRQGWAQIRKSGCLYLSKERITKESISGMEENAVILCVGLKDGISIEPADDYSKRKNVLRIKTCSSSTSNPNVTLLTSPSESQNPSLLTNVEILVQIPEDPNDLNEWVKILQQQQDNNNYYNSNKSTTNGTSTSSATTEFSPKSSIFKSFLLASPAALSSTNNSSQSNNYLAVNPLTGGLMPNPNPTSPKSKTWKGKVAKQWNSWKKMQHPSTPGSSHHTTGGYNPQGIPESGASFGVLLEDCPLGEINQSIPKVIEICVNTIESRGLGIVGIYRIPGNSAAVAALTDSLNKGNDPNPEQDPRWNDVHVISSMLKSFLRNLPDPLLTSERYPEFIRAIAETDEQVQFERLRALILDLPEINYETLRHLILHLKTVSENSERNRMEPRNLAIVFGPTLVKTADDTVASLVHDMKHQCKLVEYLINQAYEFFSVGSGNANTPSPKNISSPLSSPVPTFPDISKQHDPMLTSLSSHLFQAAQRKVELQKQKNSQPSQNTYLENNNNFRQRVRQFELETRFFLDGSNTTRAILDGRLPNPSTNNPPTIESSHTSIGNSINMQQVVAGSKPEEERMRIEKLRLETEWRKAKDDLENEDLLDDLVTRITHPREHNLYPMLSHNISTSSVSSNSTGGTVGDLPINKLGPTPFTLNYIDAFTGFSPTPSLPPKPPQINSSSSSSSTTKIMKLTSVAPGLINNPLRKVGSVEQLSIKHGDGWMTDRFTGKEAMKRLKPESKPFGSLDSLRDIDLSPRSSDGSDLVISLSKALDRKLEEIRPSHKNQNIKVEDIKQEKDGQVVVEGSPQEMTLLSSNDETDPSSVKVVSKTNGFINKDMEKPIHSDDSNVKLSAYRDPSLHRVSDASNSWPIETKSMEQSQPHLKHHRQSSMVLTKEAKSASNKLTKESRRHSLSSGTADILSLVWDHNHHNQTTTGHLNKTKNLSSDLATALAANNILESHV